MFRQIVGSMRYLYSSMPEICYEVGVINKFMSDMKKTHLLAAEQILRYIKGTLLCGLL